MNKKKYQIHKIIFISVSLAVIFDINGLINTGESFLFVFLSILCLLYGLEKLGFFIFLFQEMKLKTKFLSNKIKQIHEKINNIIFKNKNKLKKKDKLSIRSKKRLNSK